MTNDLPTSPPVDDLDPLRHDELRSGLVALADKDLSTPRRPAWQPIIASAAAVATVVAGTVTVAQLRDASSPPEPAASTVVTPTRPTPSSKPSWTAPPTGVLNLDLGPAGDIDARKASNWCMAPDDALGYRRGDGDRAVHYWSRWMKQPYRYQDGKFHPNPGGRYVLQFDDLKRLDQRALCTFDERRPFSSGLLRASEGGTEPLPPLGAGDPDAFECAVERAEIAGGRLVDGRWMIHYDHNTTHAGSRVGRIETRIAWPGGASLWHRGFIKLGAGHTEAWAAGTGAMPAVHRAELRVYDVDGKLLCETSG